MNNGNGGAYIGFNKMSEKIQENESGDRRTPEQLKEGMIRREIEVKREQAELAQAIGDLW